MGNINKQIVGIVALLLFLLAQGAYAATYTLPGDFGSGLFSSCDGSGNCSNDITLNDNTTITLTSDVNITLTGNDDFSSGKNLSVTNNGFNLTISAHRIYIEDGSSVTANLSASDDVRIYDDVTVTGDLSANNDVEIGKRSTVNGDITAGDTIDANDSVTVTGNMSAVKDIIFGENANITGNLTADNDIEIGSNSIVTGNSTSGDDIQLGDGVNYTGNLSSGDDMNLGNDINFTGDLNAGDDIDIGSNGTFYSDITAADKLNIDSTTTVIGNCSPSHPQCSVPAGATAPVANYAMDEAAWNGTSGEVADSSGSNNGTAVQGANTVAGGKLCRAAQFDGTNYVEVPNFPDMNGSFTVAAWFKTNDNTKPGQRIFADDENNTNGYAVSVGDGGTGKVRFYHRALSPIILDSANVIQNNQWYFVAAVLDTAAGQKHLYIYDEASNLLDHAQGAYSGTLGNDAGMASIGGETNNGETNNRFTGSIDELIVFDQALTSSEIQTGYSNQAAGNNWDGTARNCQPGGGGICGIVPGESTTNAVNSSSLTLAVPAGISTGDVLVAQVATRPTCLLGICGGITAPSGWTLIRQDDIRGTVQGSYYRVVDGTEPGSYTWTFSSSRAAGGITAYSGVDPDSLIEVHNGQTGSGSTITAPSVTTASDGAYLVALFAGADGNTNVTPASPLDFRYQTRTRAGGNGVAIGAGSEERPTAGATGSRSASAANTDHIGQLIALRPAICGVPAPDHFRFEHDGSGLTCNPEDIVVRACMDTNCSTEYPDAITADLYPTGWVGGDTQTFSSGDTLKLWHTTAGAATLNIASIVGAANPAARCFVGGVEQASCDMPFYDSGFLFDVPHHTAAAAQTVTLAAVRTDLTTQQCVPTFQSVSKSVNFWSTYNNPGNGTQAVAINGTDIATAAPGTAVDLDFDPNGEATLSVSYPDAGSMLLDAQYSGTGEEAGLVMVGQDSFTAKPARFRVTITGNPEAADAAGAPFMKAGEAFPVTLEALNSNDALTPNFGNESTAESALLGSPSWLVGTSYVAGTYVVPTTFTGFTYEAVTGGTSAATEPSWPTTNGATVTDDGVTWKAHSGYMPELVSPVAGVNKALTQSFVFNNGSATGTVSWPEVGIIRLTPHIGDGDYLGAGDVAATATGNIGRFYPHHFTTAVTAGDFANACPTCPTPFTYLGQGFGYGTPPTVIATAAALDGATTENYTGSYALLGTAGVTLSYPIADNTQLDKDGVNPISVNVANTSLGRSDNADGTLTFTLAGGATSDTFSYDRTLGEVAPFTADLTIELTNLSDGEADANDLATAKEIKPTGNLQRYGRAVLSDTYGDSTSGSLLSLPLTLQYYDGAGFIPNTDDTATVFSTADLGCTEGSGDVTCTIGVTGAAVGNGDSYTLTADGSTGTLLYTLVLGAKDYLQYDWNGDGTATNPVASATFGIYRGDDRFLYWREAEQP